MPPKAIKTASLATPAAPVVPVVVSAAPAAPVVALADSNDANVTLQPSRVKVYLKKYINSQDEVDTRAKLIAEKKDILDANHITKISDDTPAEVAAAVTSLSAKINDLSKHIINIVSGAEIALAVLQEFILRDLIQRAIANGSASSASEPKITVESIFTPNSVSGSFIAFYRTLPSFSYNKAREDELELIKSEKAKKSRAFQADIKKKLAALVAAYKEAGKADAETLAKDEIETLKFDNKMEQLFEDTFEAELENYDEDQARTIAQYTVDYEKFKHQLNATIADKKAALADPTNKSELHELAKFRREQITEYETAHPNPKVTIEPKSLTTYIKKIYMKAAASAAATAPAAATPRVSARFYAVLEELVEESIARIAQDLRLTATTTKHTNANEFTCHSVTSGCIRRYCQIIMRHESFPEKVQQELLTAFDEVDARLETKRTETRAKAAAAAAAAATAAPTVPRIAAILEKIDQAAAQTAKAPPAATAKPTVATARQPQRK